MRWLCVGEALGCLGCSYWYPWVSLFWEERVGVVQLRDRRVWCQGGSETGRMMDDEEVKVKMEERVAAETMGTAAVRREATKRQGGAVVGG